MGERNEATSAEDGFDFTRSECWVRALQAFGTAHIFELRALESTAVCLGGSLSSGS